MEIIFIVILVTLVGHGIWVGIAAILRAMLGGPESKPKNDNISIAIVVLSHFLKIEKLPSGVYHNLIRMFRGYPVSQSEWESSLTPTPAKTSGGAQSSSVGPNDVQLPPNVSSGPIVVSAANPITNEVILDAELVVEPAASILAARPSVTLAGAAPPWPAVQQAPAQQTPTAVHPLDREPAPAAPPAQPLRQLIQAFMDEKNIRWGEMISGVLIVVCAIGLVASLWSKLRDTVPYLPALVFMLGTGAFHAAGLYTLKRWQLRSVSRAVLIIGMLLIPLNFLAAAALSGDDEDRVAVTSPIYVLAVITGLVAYGIMSYYSGRALSLRDWRRIALATMGPSIGQLFINRLSIPNQSGMQATLLGAIPAASVVGAWLWHFYLLRRRTWIGERMSTGTLTLMGIGWFAFAASVGLMLIRTGQIEPTLTQLSPILSLVSGATLVLGLMLRQRVKVAQESLRTVLDAIAILCAFAMLACVYLAWPNLGLLMAVGLANAVLLGFVAWRGSLQPLWVGATLCGSLAALVGLRLIRAEFTLAEPTTSRQLVGSLMTGFASCDLAFLSLIVAGGAAWLNKLRRREDALYVFGSAGVLSAASVLVATKVGFLGGPGSDWSAVLLLLYATATLVAGFSTRRKEANWSGSALLLAGLVQTFRFNETVAAALGNHEVTLHLPIVLAAVVHATVAMLITVVTMRVQGKTADSPSSATRLSGFVNPLAYSAMGSSAVALPWIVIVQNYEFGWHSGYACGVAMIWLAGSIIIDSLAAFVAFECMTVISASLLGSYVSQITGNYDGWFRWRHLQVQMCFGALLTVIWTVARSSLTRFPVWQRFRTRPFYFVDRAIFYLVQIALFINVIVASAIGIGDELGLKVALLDRNPSIDAFAWFTLVLVMAAVVVSLRERVTEFRLASLAVLGAVVPVFIAVRFNSDLAFASALRWGLAAYGLIFAGLIVYRNRLVPVRWQSAWLGVRELTGGTTHGLRVLSLILTAVPVIVITAATAILAAQGHAPAGPVAGSWFQQIGSTISFATPLAVITVTMIVHAIRERQPWFMLAGSAVFQFIVTLGYILPLVTAGRALGRDQWIECSQWNNIGLAGFSVFWLCIWKWVHDPSVHDPSVRLARIAPAHSLLSIQLGLTASVTAILSGMAAANIFLDPSIGPGVITALGSLPGFMACVCTAGALALSYFKYPRPSWPHKVCSPLAITGTTIGCLSPLFAAAASIQNVTRPWFAYHVLTFGWLLSCVIYAAGCAILEFLKKRAPSRMSSPEEGAEVRPLRALLFNSSRLADRIRFWVLGFGGAALLLAWRGSFSDPSRPVWQLIVAAVLIGSSVIISLLRSSSIYSYLSCGLAGVGGLMVWIGTMPKSLFQGFAWPFAATIVAAGGWLIGDIWSQQRKNQYLLPSGSLIPVQQFATRWSLPLLAIGIFVVTWLGSLFDTNTRWASSWSGIFLVSACGLLYLGALWDRRSPAIFAGLYYWGIVVGIIVVDALHLNFVRSFLGFGCVLGVITVLSGGLWKRGPRLAAQGAALGISEPIDGLAKIAGWLPTRINRTAILAALIALICSVTYRQRDLRIIAAFIPALLAWSAAAVAQHHRRLEQLRRCLIWGATTAVLIGWADIQPEGSAIGLLTRAVRLLMVLSAVAFMYQIVIPRWLAPTSDWRMPMRRSAVIAACVGIVTLLAIMLFEVGIFWGGGSGTVPLTDPQLVAVSVVMIGLIVALLAAALSPEHDPFQLRDEQRMFYVYGAQAAAALLFAHLYLCRRHWFHGFIDPYWPYIVMVIAFAGVGVSELFRRSGRKVLSEPLERTGSFLPLVPAIGMWAVASQSDYSMLLFLAGLLYLYLSYTRKSMVSGIAAAVAGNGALWQLLVNNDFDVLRQPQIWMVPPAVSFLVATELNRSRLAPAKASALRYGCLMVIYLSSTGEMFIRGIGESIWSPIVLLTLSIAGAFAGIILRVRSFLYLGSVFTFVSLISMVWHASRAIEHSWPLWAFGIAMAGGILVLFGVFEKRRDDLRRVASALRQWEK